MKGKFKVIHLYTYGIPIFLHILCARAQVDTSDLRNVVIETGLKSASDVKYVGRNFVHTAMIMTNVLGKPKKEKDITVEFKMYDKKSKLLAQFERMIQSILLHSTGTPLHFIFITEEESMHIITKVLKDEIGKYLSELIIKIPQYTTWKVPKLKVEFVDIESITSKHREEIDLMKTYFGHYFPPDTAFNCETGRAVIQSPKYTLDLFYILPFYHLEFPEDLEKLIVIDIDLEFRFV
jgi:hypothetical protein